MLNRTEQNRTEQNRTGIKVGCVSRTDKKQNAHADEILNSEECSESRCLTLQDDVAGQDKKNKSVSELLDLYSNDVKLGNSSHLSPLTFRQFAFTLSEVLLTIGIIGIIGAMTIPALINNIQDMQYKTAYKKAYSDASNVWQKMAADYEIAERKGSRYDDNAATQNFTVFKSHFKVIKDCGFSGNSNRECWDFSGGTISPAGTMDVPIFDNSLRYAAFIDTEGRQWIKNYALSTFGEIIFVDTNGFKKPNQFGKDRFPLFPVLSTCKNNFISDDVCVGSGVPEVIKPYDRDSVKGYTCNVDKCYYNSWLY